MKPSALLSRRPSDENEAETNWTDVQAEETDKCFKQNDLYTALEWLISYRENVEAMVEKGYGTDKTFPQHVRAYLSFVVQCLLDKDDWTMLPMFTAEVERISNKAPMVVSPLALALCNLVKTPLDSAAGFDMTCLAQWPERKNKFQRSLMFIEYRKQRGLTLMTNLRNASGTPANDRLVDIDKMSKEFLSDNDRQELKTMQTVLHPTVLEDEKYIFLLTGADRLATMAKWIPSDERLLLASVARVFGTLLDVSAADFMNLAARLIHSERLVDAVPNSFAKAVLKEHRTADLAAQDSTAKIFVAQIFAEVAAYKLGVDASKLTSPAQGEEPQLSDELVKTLNICVSVLWRKFTSEATTPSLKALAGKLQAKAAADAKAKACAEAQAAAAEAKAKAKATTEAPANSQEEQADGGKHEDDDGEADEISQHSWTVGMLVKTISRVNKDALHDKKAQIKVVNASSAQVEFLEGPLRGETRKRTFKQMQALEDKKEEPVKKKAYSASALVPAAGTSASVERACAIFKKAGVGGEECD